VQRWIVGIGTLLLGAFVLSLAVPRLAAHVALMPGNAALKRLTAGEVLTDEGYQRILRSREAALRWVELPQARIDLGETHYLMAQFADVTGVDPEESLVQARRELELALTAEPADPRHWLWLADVNQALGDHERAAEAVRLSLLAAPNDVGLAAARAGLALRYWGDLPPEAKAIAARDARKALASPDAGAFVADAAERDRLGPLREAVAGDRAASAKLAALASTVTTRSTEERTTMPPPRLGAAAAATAALLASTAPVAAMTVQEFLTTAGDSRQQASLARYFEGFGDALYDFNAIMQGAGVTVFCPAGRTRPVVGTELQRRITADLARKRGTDPDFATYARETSLGLVALEVLTEAHPCEDEEGGAAPTGSDAAAPPPQ
jgi:tetratricopeptide (TPR) repeat protein